MNQSLNQIATIKTGVFAKPEPHGEIVYLQSNHFDESGKLSSNPQPELNADAMIQKHLLKSKDVLFAAKGRKNFAAVYKNEFPAVASTTFFVLSMRRDDVLPEYLAWVLNNPSTLKYLKWHAKGSAMVSISKSILAKLEISIPSIEKQKTILAISRLSDKENGLRSRLAELRHLKIQQQINKAIRQK